MMTRPTSRLSTPALARIRLADALARFLRARRGSIALEFSVLFPTLIVLLVACFTGFNAFRSSTHLAKTSHAVNDITSRYDVVDTKTVQDLFALQTKLLPSYMDQHSMRVTSICLADGKYRVMWSQVETQIDLVKYPELKTKVSLLTPMVDDTIPLDVMPTIAEQGSVVMTELSALYDPVIPGYWGEKRWYSDLIIRPRFVRIIPHTDLNAGTLCPIDAPTPLPSEETPETSEDVDAIDLVDDDDDDDDKDVVVSADPAL